MPTRGALQFVTITDGEPTGPGERLDTTRNVIKRAKDYLGTLPYGSGSAAFMFAQVEPHIRLAATPCQNLLASQAGSAYAKQFVQL